MGQVVVRDLVESTPVKEVVIADYNEKRANQLKDKYSNPKVSAAQADLRDLDRVVTLLKGADVIVNSSPYQFNLEVMQAALKARCHYLDLGGLFHMTRKQLELHEQFLKADVLAVLGMGCAP